LTLGAALVPALAAGLLTLPALAVPRAPGYIESGPPSNVLPQKLEGVAVDEHLGQMLPLDVKLKDQDGKDVLLGDYFRSGRPVVVNLAYYACPMLCGLVMKGLTRSVGELSYVPGKEFDIVTVSIDEREDTRLASDKRATVLEEIGKPEAAKGWTFHTASAQESARLADAVGFRYHWDEKGKQWAHPASVVFASPEGKIVRYLYGIEYPPGDFKLAALEASQGKVGTTTDHLLLYCFRYDPESRGYVLFARNLMKAGGAITLLVLGGLLLVLWRRDKAR
jgi:protein SCO1